MPELQWPGFIFYTIPNQTPHIFNPVPCHFLIAHERIGLMISSCSSTKLSRSATSLAFQMAAATYNLPCELIDLKTCQVDVKLVDNCYIDIGPVDYQTRGSLVMTVLGHNLDSSHDQEGTHVSFCDQLVEVL